MINQSVIPRHIAIVMDGNGRWAQQRRRPRLYGHHRGAEAVRSTVKTCGRLSVECLTLFAFSSENWKRPEDEVKGLMTLLSKALDREAKGLIKHGVRLRFIGDTSAFSQKLQEKIAHVEALTAEGDGLLLQIAANYGGRWDIVQATQKIIAENPDAVITEESISSYVSTSDVPDPDLFIRTGGERRISNFLLWQLAYSELYFTDLLWPDFDEQALIEAIKDFSGRQRRFGMTGEQVKEGGHA
ncbi:polyprenyl diphosphate synthase [Leucothrix pacifica]|uniref:Ditrans,polycis-undecaprenyl-diphosphate synthase ((2E,6E)-farnesyl-diphosphate specific) n=1 Tax=Leucothrix pacifica TaxID=1247513 RepID=A0A317C237_9GAMM|nr:polyprenyl diphosphate synthase [Leucothrix pacifica]PWQ92684.1 di-trans,poly-cis-decaprenylcistransferase [Leucothrix pacifica]